MVTRCGKTKQSTPAPVPARPDIGERAYRQYLKDSLRYTSGSRKGKVIVGFTVAANGELKNIQVLKSLCPACDAEAIRLVQEGPAWKPATQNGTPVEQKVKVKIKFKPHS